MLKSAILLSVLITASGASHSARAADPDFCRDYAREAVHQYHEASDHRRCAEDYLRDSSVWTDDWRHHYNWCLTADRDDVWRQRHGRERIVDYCNDYNQQDYDHYDYDRNDDHNDYDRHDHPY